MKLISVFLLLLVFNLACTVMSNDQSIAHSVMHSFGEQQTKTNGLTLLGLGGSFYDKVSILDLHFYSDRALTVEQVRGLYISSTQQLLQMVNTNCKIRPYLRNYPFNENNLKFSISFYSKDNGFLEYPAVAHVFLLNGKISYNYYNNKEQKFIDGPIESYADALKIVGR